MGLRLPLLVGALLITSASCGQPPGVPAQPPAVGRPLWFGPDEVGRTVGGHTRGGAVLDLAMAGQFGFDGRERAGEQALLISAGRGYVLIDTLHRYGRDGAVDPKAGECDLDPKAGEAVKAWIAEATRGGATRLRFVFRIDVKTPWKGVRSALALVDDPTSLPRSLRFQFLPCLREPVGFEAAIDAEPEPASAPEGPVAGVLAFERPPRTGRPAHVRASWAGRSWDFPADANASWWDLRTHEDLTRARATRIESNRIWDEIGGALEVVAQTDPVRPGTIQLDVGDAVEWGFVAQGIALALHAKATRVRLGSDGPLLRLRAPPPLEPLSYPDPFPDDPPALLVVLLGVTAAAALYAWTGRRHVRRPAGQRSRPRSPGAPRGREARGPGREPGRKSR